MLEIANWLVDNVNALHGAATPEDVQRLCGAELRSLLDFKGMIAVVGKVSEGRLHILKVINCGYPTELVHEVEGTCDLASRPTVVKWLQDRRPTFIDVAAVPAATQTPREYGEVHRYGLGCRAVHGMIDSGGSVGTYFSLCGIPPRSKDRVLAGLQLLTPHLHVALTNVWRAQGARAAASLSTRERQLIRMLIQGKTNPQIAVSWNRSVPTVRNLLHGLMVKLRVTSRIELLTLVADGGLFDVVNWLS